MDWLERLRAVTGFQWTWESDKGLGTHRVYGIGEELFFTRAKWIAATTPTPPTEERFMRSVAVTTGRLFVVFATSGGEDSSHIGP